MLFSSKNLGFTPNHYYLMVGNRIDSTILLAKSDNWDCCSFASLLISHFLIVSFGAWGCCCCGGLEFVMKTGLHFRGLLVFGFLSLVLNYIGHRDSSNGNVKLEVRIHWKTSLYIYKCLLSKNNINFLDFRIIS